MYFDFRIMTVRQAVTVRWDLYFETRNHPKDMDEWPPGGASRRVVERPVITLPTFCPPPDPLAYLLEEILRDHHSYCCP